jgi:putative addiction module killer protein
VEHEIKMLALEGGRCPFEEWYAGLRDIGARTRIRARIMRLQSGNFGDCKSVGQGVHELRLDFGPGYRIYFARTRRTVVVLLAGGDKSTQERDIERAKQLWEEHRNVPERLQRDFQ